MNDVENLGLNRSPELIESGPGTSAAGTRGATRSATKPARATAAAAAAAAVEPYPGELERRREIREKTRLIQIERQKYLDALAAKKGEE
jgi:hypothetical protein